MQTLLSEFVPGEELEIGHTVKKTINKSKEQKYVKENRDVRSTGARFGHISVKNGKNIQKIAV